MTENSLKINYKIYLEAEDISQSRIQSCTSFVKEIVKNHENTYLNRAEFDDESDLDDFTLRLFAEEKFEEAVCSNEIQAKAFVDDIVDLLFEIAHMHSFLDMDGSFSIELGEEKKVYKFHSESGDSLCDFEEE